MEEKTSKASTYENYKNWITSCVKDNGYVMEPLWKEQGNFFRNFQSRSDDIWIMTLPRSGTTLAQEIVFLIMNDFNFDIAKKYPFFSRVPSINSSLCPHFWHGSSVLTRRNDDPSTYELIECDSTKSSAEFHANLRSPRIFKCHLPFSVVPSILKSNAKVIYIVRNPKDRLASWCKLLPTNSGHPCEMDFVTFWKYVKNEQILYEPTWKHIKEGWAQRNNPNVLFLFYEEMIQDLSGTIKKIADFIGKSCTAKQIEDSIDFLQIDNFRSYCFDSISEESNSVVLKTREQFVCQGKIGGYKEVIPQEIIEEMDEWIFENLRGTDIPMALV